MATKAEHRFIRGQKQTVSAAAREKLYLAIRLPPVSLKAQRQAAVDFDNPRRRGSLAACALPGGGIDFSSTARRRSFPFSMYAFAWR